MPMAIFSSDIIFSTLCIKVKETTEWHPLLNLFLLLLLGVVLTTVSRHTLIPFLMGTVLLVLHRIQFRRDAQTGLYCFRYQKEERFLKMG